MSKPGKHQEPLNQDDIVIRVGLTSSQHNYDSVSPDQFIITKDERARDWKRISVYENSLTSDGQAIKLLKNKKRLFIIKLNVGEIRSIVVNSSKPFDVKWDHEWHPYIKCLDKNLNKIHGSPPGCEGHAGLDGLNSDSNNKREAKMEREELRVELARFAESKKNFYLYPKN